MTKQTPDHESEDDNQPIEAKAAAPVVFDFIEARKKNRPLNVEEAALYMRVSESWIRDHSNGQRLPKLPGRKHGKLWSFLPSELDGFDREHHN